MIYYQQIFDSIKPFTYFTTTKLLTLKEPRIGIINKLIQLSVFGWVMFDLAMNELYMKTEIPSGYTTFWAENGNLTNIQNKNKFQDLNYCNNETYNYAYDRDYWLYTNISCVNLPYSEMYSKGENEFFFITHFTENEIICNKTLENNNCLRDFHKDYFTVGSEGMLLGFDHFYITSFEEGSNLPTILKKGIDTNIKDKNGDNIAYFPAGKTIMMNVSNWLNLSNVSLDEYNRGTNPSLSHKYVPLENKALFRLSGLEIIIKINFYNMKSLSGYTTTTSDITLQANTGWSSKGSDVTYLEYPKLYTNNSYKYIDRYKYGIKFKFVISGVMGKFNMNNLITHITSGIVLIGLSTGILSTIILLSKTKYGFFFKELRYSEKSISHPSESTLQKFRLLQQKNNLRNRKINSSEDNSNELDNINEDEIIDIDSKIKINNRLPITHV
tara:strand:+ start:193 stop:1515 length:1323 start_codon:yes stop_codon:yes gene_type:complete